MLKNFVFVLMFMSLGAGITVLAMHYIAPDRREPVIKDSLMRGHEACMGCVETGRKKVIIYNKAGQVICAYYDTMTPADYQLYNHSKIPDEEASNPIPDLGTGQ